MELKNKVWMTGNLDWFAYVGDQEFYLGRREVPYPFDEGDAWINAQGDSFRIVNGEIVYCGRVEPPEREW